MDEFEQENVDVLEVLFDLVDRCAFLFKHPSDLKELRKGKNKQKKEISYVAINGEDVS